MEDTCKGKECWFYKIANEWVGQGNTLDFKDCPFYQEMIFTPTPVGGKVETAKTVRDCVNKRSLLILLEEVFPRLLGVQQSNEAMRNSTEEAKNKLVEYVKILSVVNDSPRIREVEEATLIPNGTIKEFETAEMSVNGEE